MNVKLSIYLSLSFCLGLINAFGQTYEITIVETPGERKTKMRQAPVPVKRSSALVRMNLYRLQEQIVQRTFSQNELLTSVFWFQWRRNCHDYAWAPFMDCMCNPPPSGGQSEAWWMDDPSKNWKDGPPSSMKNVLNSELRSNATAQEYLFNTATLASIRSQYYNVLVQPIGLPACPLRHLVGNDYPAHSVVLVDTILVSDSLSAGIYQSKWGDLGIFKHRYGLGHVPKAYLEAYIGQNGFGTTIAVDAPYLRLFAPGDGWLPPYWVTHSPYGL